MDIDKHNAKIKDMLTHDPAWTMAFTELCDDGILRPIIVNVGKIMNVQRLNAPVDVKKFGLPDDFSGGSCIMYVRREILLYESFEHVLQALGVLPMAVDFSLTHSIYAEHFIEKNIPYSPESETQPTFEEDAPRWSMVFTEICKDGVKRPITLNLTKITSMHACDVPAENPQNSPANRIGRTCIIYDEREIKLHESMTEVIETWALSRFIQYFWSRGTDRARQHNSMKEWMSWCEERRKISGDSCSTALPNDDTTHNSH